MNKSIIKIFLRLAISLSFLSAVADRFGMWGPEVSVWGSWDNFVAYTALINPWFPNGLINALAVVATILEIGFAICLLLGFKTETIARWSGVLLLIFGLSMTFSTGIKGALDYSVFTAAAAAFALSLMNEKYWELDNFMSTHMVKSD